MFTHLCNTIISATIHTLTYTRDVIFGTTHRHQKFPLKIFWLSPVCVYGVAQASIKFCINAIRSCSFFLFFRCIFKICVNAMASFLLISCFLVAAAQILWIAIVKIMFWVNLLSNSNPSTVVSLWCCINSRIEFFNKNQNWNKWILCIKTDNEKVKLLNVIMPWRAEEIN